ncbi:MAG: TetR/AcrR family transcriptional regulator [Eubacteriales bacterium]|nr:TetR/AcrR family transcriptional regulator [Eubacteriales bacterium]
MARNKHPEETVNLILDAAFRLFIEKGYERTSIQDIINELGGLSKGAIYHHFKSKEDILVAVTDRMTAESNKMLADIRDSSELSGNEKLRTIFKESIRRPVQDEIFTVAPNLGNNPRLMYSIFRETIDDAAPNYIRPIIEQGIADGSIQTESPAELAELIILAANIWMNPMLFDDSEEKAYRKFMIFRQMMQGFGLDIVDDEMLDRLQELASIYQKNKSCGK